MKSIFREYDIRGIFEKELNEDIVKKIGFYLGLKIQGQYVALGYDARTHSPILFNYLTSGLNKAGKTVLNMGLVATPVNYFSNYTDFDGITPSASIMITGSHNPSEYNGFKITIDKKPFFGEDIYALGDEVCASTEVIKDSNDVIVINSKEKYIDYIVNEFQDLKGFDKKIVYDCGNGVAGVVIDEIFEKLELDVKGLFTEADGSFPNHHPDPTVEKNLVDIKQELVGEVELGFAYDGDADRIAVLTQKNNIKGDILALLYSANMKNPTVIGEVKCSQVMYDLINERGGKGVMYKTGHSNLKVKLKELNADLAAEVSGHIFFNDRYFGFDDAIYSTFRTLELLKEGMDFDAEIAKLPLVYSTEELKVETTEEDKFPTIDKVKELLKSLPEDFPTVKEVVEVDGVRIIFEDGWGLVRASNTTPVLVTRFESKSEANAKLYEEKVNALILKAKENL